MIGSREEAIKILEMFLHKQCDLERIKFAYSQEEIWNAVKMATEALEKQIPKKPKNTIKRPNGMYGNCPVCNHAILKEKYCPRCGTALDWTEEGET